MNEPRLDLEHVEVDVEPLGDPRWTRIERGMFSKLDRPLAVERATRVSGRLLWAGGACALAAAAAVAVVLGRPLSGASSTARTAAPRASDPVRLVTTSSPSRFTIGESSLWIEPSSLVLVSGDDEHGVDVVLDRGTVTCEVAPRRGRPPFVVDAGEVRVQVVGTRFTVTRGAAETSVGVDHGVVEVAVGGVVTVLHDGERWPVPATAPAGGVAAVTSGGPGSPGEASPPEASLPGASLPGGSSPSAPTEAAPVVPHVSPSAHRLGASATAPGLSVPTAAMPGGGASGASAPTSASGGSAAVAPASPSAQQVFESAARIERTRPDEAAALYREVAAGSSAWAGNALFALGRLEADRGRRPEATRLLQEYLTRYPRGINVDDARALLQPLQ